MKTNTIYGIGGYCVNCDPSHDHPLHNIVEEVEIPDPPVDEQELLRQSALEKLTALGLTEDEARAIAGV